MRLSLHALTVRDVGPDKVVEIAAAEGCDHVCLFVAGPEEGIAVLPRIADMAEARRIRRQMGDAGITACNVDTFLMMPSTDPDAYDGFLDMGAVLGAKSVTVLGADPDLDRAGDKLARFAELAAPRGIRPVVEWYRFIPVNTLKGAFALARAGEGNVGLNVDILHLIRNGETLADLAAVDPAMIPYAQICDGLLAMPDEETHRNEAGQNRDWPGEGEFPLVDFVRLLPSDIVISVEAPVMRLAERLSPRERARQAIKGAREVLKSASILQAK